MESSTAEKGQRVFCFDYPTSASTGAEGINDSNLPAGHFTRAGGNRAPNLTEARSKSSACRDGHFARPSARFMRNGAAVQSEQNFPVSSDTTNSFPGRLPSLHHDFPQRLIDPRLVATSLLLEPGQHIGVQTQGDWPLDRSVQSPNIRDQIVRPLRLRG
jgi:hypothetical protein